MNFESVFNIVIAIAVAFTVHAFFATREDVAKILTKVEACK